MELKRILIVEDDADIAAIERDYLELGGYAVTPLPRMEPQDWMPPCISRLT